MVSSKSSLSHALESDQLLCGFGAVELKIMLDIVMENQRPEGFTACEIGAGSGAFTKQVSYFLVCCDYYSQNCSTDVGAQK